jgi:CheY-like chemotaxis protein
MQEAKFGIFDDSEYVRQAIADLLENDGHHLVVEAETVEEAERKIVSLRPGEIDVALVDGNFSGANDNQDGAKVAEILRSRLGTTVHILGISGTEKPIEGTDEDITKNNLTGIREHIAKL